jgi:hypothetical protein
LVNVKILRVSLPADWKMICQIHSKDGNLTDSDAGKASVDVIRIEGNA